MGQAKTVKVQERKILCEGDPHFPLGHPRVYLDVGDSRGVDCPYCGRRYILKKEEPKDD